MHVWQYKILFMFTQLCVLISIWCWTLGYVYTWMGLGDWRRYEYLCILKNNGILDHTVIYKFVIFSYTFWKLLKNNWSLACISEAWDTKLKLGMHIWSLAWASENQDTTTMEIYVNICEYNPWKCWLFLAYRPKRFFIV